MKTPYFITCYDFCLGAFEHLPWIDTDMSTHEGWSEDALHWFRESLSKKPQVRWIESDFKWIISFNTESDRIAFLLRYGKDHHFDAPDVH